jgi:predicted HicB family RNase H-like nuclease
MGLQVQRHRGSGTGDSYYLPGKVTIRPSDEQHEAYVVAATAAGVSLKVDASGFG